MVIVLNTTWYIKKTSYVTAKKSKKPWACFYSKQIKKSFCFQITHLSSVLMYCASSFSQVLAWPWLCVSRDSLKSSTWVLHSYRPSILLSQRSCDTNIRKLQSQTELFPVPRGCEKNAHWAQSYGQRGECQHRAKKKKTSKWQWCLLWQTFRSVDEEEERQKSNSVSNNTRVAVYNKS